MTPNDRRLARPWHERFRNLMPFRIREILMLSSAYDAFAFEEDGPLTDRLFSQYSELNLSDAPRITHAETVREAMHLLAIRRFDLVITVLRVEDGDAASFSRRVKERYPAMPLVLLTFDDGDLRWMAHGVPETIDRAFVWTGDANVLIAAIKHVEDSRNVEHDALADVQVMLVVEDQARAYSSFLGLLYPELMRQAHSLIADGVNDLHRLRRLRARPKILLANDFEQALKLYRTYRENALTLISDVRFPRAGVETAEAGFELATMIREDNPELPVLFQSSEQSVQERVQALGASFADKRSPRFRLQVRQFLREELGFGEFIFRLSDGSEIRRASSAYEMEQALLEVPAASVHHHSSRKDFSVWLKARNMFDLARRIRPRGPEHFDTIEHLRQYLVRVLQEARAHEQESAIADMSADPTGAAHRFVRVGSGSLGGKARGLAFLNTRVVRRQLPDFPEGLELRIPKSIVIGTDEFDRFTEHCRISDDVRRGNDRRITQKLMEGTFRPELLEDLRAAFLKLRGPLAVRSSSLLEDSRIGAFAGVYSTYLLPNNHADVDVRFAELRRAIKGVYASTFSKEARSYIAGTPHATAEKMAIVVQQVVGRRFGNRYYPHLSGVAQSYNYYPFGHQKSEHGIATIALGLGEMVMAGGRALRFCPGAPEVLPQFPNARAYVDYGQRQFFALNLDEPEVDILEGPRVSLSLHDLSAAEADGTLALAGSVYSEEDDVIRDNLRLPGARVVTFQNVLKWNAVPLAEALSVLLRVLHDAMASEVELEFALDMGHPGQGTHATSAPRVPRLYLLQLRPMASLELQGPRIDLDSLPQARVLCKTRQALGHGFIDTIRDIVYVKPQDFGTKLSKLAASDVGALNDRLRENARPYLLLGPGRWGTQDPTLGVPVRWSQIAGAKIMVELPLGDRHVDPSQGTHFFHNLTSHRIGYLTVTPGAEGFLDREWLDRLPAETETDLVRHVAFDSPIEVHMDGRQARAVVIKPGSDD